MKKRCKTSKGLLCGIMIFMSLMSGQTLLAQQINITGKVTNDQSKEALVGVTILEKGTSNGALTDALGNYSIKVSNANSILVFSFVGLESQEIVVGGQKVIDVAMKENVSMLNEVIVTGYGTQRRSDLTGSVAVVKVDETKDVASGSVLQSIQGKVAGLYITSTGDPSGRASSINIRGVNTLGFTAPLYIIDGVPTIDPNVLQNMDQNSIESFQVLKDASAASIYGSRAANGVVIVTTKTGKGQMSVSFNASYSIEKYVRKYNMANANEYGQILWQGAINDGSSNPNNSLYSYDWHRDANNVAILDAVHPVQFIAGDPTLPSGDTDWQKQVFKTGLVSSNTLTISGSTDRTSTLVNLSLFANKGIVITTKYDRVSLRVNNTVNFLDRKLKIGENVQISGSTSIPTPSDPARSVINLSTDLIPLLPVYKTDGTFAGPLGAGFSDRHNPVHMAELNKNDRNNQYQLFGNVFMEVTPIKNLVFKTSFGVEGGLNTSKNIQPVFQEGFLSNAVNSLSISETQALNYTWSNTLSYQLVSGRSRATVLIGTEAISNKSVALGATRQQFAVEDVNYYYLNAGTGSASNSGSGTANKLLSYFGNVNYVFADKYMLAGTVRYDGSSRFGENNRFGLFPSVSAGWVISKEEFMKGIGLISNLKLRAGIGLVGNQEIGDYSRFQLWVPNYGAQVVFSPIGIAFMNTGTAYDLNGLDTGTLPSGYQANQTANPDLKWESTRELNVGMDFGFINQKITGSFDYFSRKTTDILTTPPILSAIGEGGTQTVNGATMENTGWEFTLGYSDKKGDFGYSFTANLSHFADKITYLPANVVRTYASNTEQTIIGHSRTSMFGYITDGLFQSQAEVDAHANQPGKGIGRIRYKDLNNDGLIDQLDQTWLGTTNPKLIYGITGEFSYKNLGLLIFVNGVQGRLVNDQAKVEKNSFLGLVSGQNKGASLLNAWTPQNTGSTIPMLSSSNNNNEGRSSDYTIVNGSFVKLQTLQLSYTLPKSVTRFVKMQSARIYCIGENLLLFFDKKGPNAFTGPDPETPVALQGAYPKAVKVTFGIDVKF